MRAVDHEVCGHAHRQRHRANDVLNHAIGGGFVKLTVGCKCGNMFLREVGCCGNQRAAFFNAEFVQSLDSTVVNRHVAPVDGWGVRSLKQSPLS